MTSVVYGPNNGPGRVFGTHDTAHLYGSRVNIHSFSYLHILHYFNQEKRERKSKRNSMKLKKKEEAVKIAVLLSLVWVTSKKFEVGQ